MLWVSVFLLSDVENGELIWYCMYVCVCVYDVIVIVLYVFGGAYVSGEFVFAVVSFVI